MPLISADNKYVKLYNIVCDPSPKWTENATCDLKVIGRNVVVANMEMDIKQPFKNVSVHFQFFKFYNQFRPFLIDVNFNVCNTLFKKSASNFYMNLLLRVLSKYSNAVNCHLEGHLYARNLEIKYEFFKFFIEEGKYRFNFEFFEGYPLESLGKVTLFFEIFNKYKKPKEKSKTEEEELLT
ncbi:hypothetical protein ACFFRR_006534 [Megaselia abdita]